jgi:hypothetical protein
MKDVDKFKTNRGSDARLVRLDKPYKDGSKAYKIEVWDGDKWVVRVPRCHGFAHSVQSVKERY